MHLSSIQDIPERVGELWSSASRRRAYRREIRQALAEGRRPLIVFTMAKSASTSVEVSLMQLPELAVFKVHRLHPARIRAYHRERRRRGEREAYRSVHDLGLAVYDEIILRRIPARVVVLVREPIGRNFSAYFHILHVLWKQADAYRSLTVEQIAAGFLEKGRHRVPLDWFDEEFRPVFGVDVFRTPFPHDSGFVRLAAGPHDILLMRADLDDARKAACLAEWLGKEEFELLRFNDADEKHYAEQYAAARARLRLPEQYLSEMLDSRYTRHFFAPEESDRLRETWGAATQEVGGPAFPSPAHGMGT